MGYSLSVSCRSGKARDRMARFLREHAIPFTTLMWNAPEKDEYLKKAWGEATEEEMLLYDPTQYFNVGNEIAYGAGPSRIGFNFTTGGIHADYMYSMMGWMALRVGTRRGLNALSDVGYAHLRVPYYKYDSHDITPVLTFEDTSDWSDPVKEHARHRWVVDEFGCRVRTEEERYDYMRTGSALANWAQRKIWLDNEIRKNELTMQVVRREMRRLAELWNDPKREAA